MQSKNQFKLAIVITVFISWAAAASYRQSLYCPDMSGWDVMKRTPQNMLMDFYCPEKPSVGDVLIDMAKPCVVWLKADDPKANDFPPPIRFSPDGNLMEVDTCRR